MMTRSTTNEVAESEGYPDPLANPLPVLLEELPPPATATHTERILADNGGDSFDASYFIGRPGTPTASEVEEILALEALTKDAGPVHRFGAFIDEDDIPLDELTDQDTPLPPPTSAHSRYRQTLHTWEVTPRSKPRNNSASVSTLTAGASSSVVTATSGAGVSSAVETAASGACAPAGAGSGGTVTATTDVNGQRRSASLHADSSQEVIFAEVGAHAEQKKKKETVAEVRLRVDDNCARIILAFCKFRDEQAKMNKEILKRLNDFGANVTALRARGASTGGDSLSADNVAIVAGMQSEVRKLRAAAESQHHTTALLTTRMNTLINVPNQLVAIQAQSVASSRTSQELATQVAALGRSMNAGVAAASQNTAIDAQLAASNRATQELVAQLAVLNRQATADAATGRKQPNIAATTSEAPRSGTKRNFDEMAADAPFDVFVYPIFPHRHAALIQVGHSILESLQLEKASLRSVKRAEHPSDGVLSLRFHTEFAGRAFLDGIQDNNCDDVTHLEACTPKAYAKRKDQRGGKKNGAGGKPYRLNKTGGLKIAFWNVHGRLAVKITDPKMLDVIHSHDIVVFQETFLRPGEENTLKLPAGYVWIAASRKDVSYCDARGGIAIVISSRVPYTVCDGLSGPDLLVLDLGQLFLIGAYILPEASDWRYFTDVHPAIRFCEAMAACCASPEKGTLAGGDLNGRTGDAVADVLHLARNSSDKVPKDTRGRLLIRSGNDNDMCILNGTRKERGTPGRCTSFQGTGPGRRETVIDYVLASVGLLPSIEDGALQILDHLCYPPDELSDHAILSITINLPEPVGAARIPSRRLPRQCGPMPIRNPTKLDVLADRAAEAALSPEAATDQLYGFAVAARRKRSVYLATSQKGMSRASYALYWGPGCSQNGAFACDGAQSSSRAALLAVHAAVMMCDPNIMLIIYTSSLYAIRTFCYWAGASAVRGWDCQHGEVIEACARDIRTRAAAVEFRLANDDGSASLSLARELAKEGRNRENLPTLTLSSVADSDSVPSNVICTPPECTRKVITNVPEASPPKDVVRELTLEECFDPDDSHRGRWREREMLRNNLNKLMTAACEGPREYWDVICGWTNSHRIPPAVPPQQLHASFKRRLNPPERLPTFFDAEAYETICALFRGIPKHTEDRTPQHFFSRKITESDMKRMKKKLRSKTVRSSVGVDDLSYAKILSIPNHCLVELFQTCIDDCDAPQRWLITILVGILKQGKAVDDPESYRLVGLECCLLKMMTWLFDERLREWADSIDAIPESQNGFRPGRRTQDNVFILTSAISRARADGKTLYVFFGDMTNAFPYTDIPTLWNQLYAAGAAGPFFDWMRMVYARMEYATRHADNCAAFKSMIGVLTGDTASPGLWNFFFGDYQVPIHVEDIELNGKRICQVEQADDNALFTTAFIPFQEKVTYYWNYCAWKRVLASVPKSKWSAYGPLPRVIPDLLLGDHSVEFIYEFKFLGLWLSSVTANIFARHYVFSASKARNAAFAAFALRHRVGTMPVKAGLILYTARVDCYLISGAEVCIDTDGALVREFTAVQHEFLRRLLGVSSRSALAPLFSETGLMPIRVRRLVLALGRLQYMLSLDDTRVVRDALTDSIALFERGHSSWAGDLAIALSRLPMPIRARPHDFRNIEAVENIRKAVLTAVDLDVQSWIDNSDYHPLLHRRLELQDNTLTLVTRRLRHYLTMLDIPSHRKALTRLMLGEHCFAVTRLRFATKIHHPVPREDCICRMCAVSVEDEVHVLLECEACEPLVALRAEFLDEVTSADVSLAAAFSANSRINFLRKVLASRKAVKWLGKYVWEVTKVLEGLAIVVPDKYRKQPVSLPSAR